MIPQLKIRNNFFINFFFTSAVIEWNKFDSDIQNSPSYLIVKKSILNFIRPCSNNIFLTRLSDGTQPSEIGKKKGRQNVTNLRGNKDGTWSANLQV